MSERAYEAWIIAAAGEDASRRFDVPEDCGATPMWVRVRPLTAREALQREALGLTERYDLGPDGAPVAMRREYDQAAMVEFELQCCLLDYELPMRVGGDLTAGQTTNNARARRPRHEGLSLSFWRGGASAAPTHSGYASG